MPELKKFPIHDGVTTFGLHLMLDAYGANTEALGDMKRVFQFLHDLPDMIGMKKLGLPVVYNAEATETGFDPGGITGFVVIAESHIAIHTFADRGFFTMDVYSCSDFTDQIDTLLAHTKETFGMGEHELQVVKRGTKYPMPERITVTS